MIYAVIDFCKKAKELCATGNYNLRIFYYRDKQLIGKDMFSNAKIDELVEKRIPIIWKAKYDIPNECVKEPTQQIFFGRIRYNL